MNYKKLLFSTLALLNVSDFNAAPGDIDTSFIVDPGAPLLPVLDLALQSDGKIVAGLQDGFTLARYNTNGSLDPTFGTNGIETTPSLSSNLNSIAIQSDGKIVGGGGLGGQFTLARYNTDGSLDPTFGINGVATGTTPGSTLTNIFREIAIQPDGKIVGGGVTFSGTVFQAVLARFNTNGSLDPTFGTNGIETTGLGFDSFGIRSLAIQPDGKIVATGRVMARYNTDGSLDLTFGTNGVTAPLPIELFSSNTIAIQPDGKIVAGGSINAPFRFALARYNIDGSLDLTFGTNGVVETLIDGPFGANSSIFNIAIQTDGKILAGGRAHKGAFQSALARYNTNGSLDNTFGDNGIVINPNADVLNATVIQANGNIVAGTLGNKIFVYIGNNTPIANNTSASTQTNTGVSIPLTGSDANGDPLTFSIVSGPSDGALGAVSPIGPTSGNAMVTYTPTTGFKGADSLTFKVNDGIADSAPATVSITVTNATPIANNTSASTQTNTGVAIPLTGSDANGDPLTFSIVSGPSNGTIAGLPVVGSPANATYTPSAGYFGADSFTFKVNDGIVDSAPATVSINVLAPIQSALSTFQQLLVAKYSGRL